ncbi:MAG TPA: isochorismatase family protein [Candidatus Fimivivens faecavium]|nr:isochorismatase family protein [Candidatus Fimivivens faecavium]
MNVTEKELEQRLPEMAELLREKARALEALPGMRLSELPPGETLIVSIDLNRGFAVEGALASKEAGALVEPTAAFLRECRARGYQTLCYSDRHTDASPELRAFPPHCMEGTAEWELAGSLLEHAGRVVYKNSTNGVLAEGGNPAEDAGKRFFVVTGCLTEICIYQYALTLRAWLNEHNIPDAEVIVPMELIDSYDAPGHPAFYYNLVFGSSLLENGIRVVRRIIY